MSIALTQIGINAYTNSPLQGCRNDLLNLQAELTRRFADLTAHRKLIDSHATAGAIRQALAELTITDAPIRIFQQSSHGAFLPDLNHDEATHPELTFDSREPGTTFDQCLVPYDYETAGMLIDDELGAYSDLIPEGVKFILWLDSCYSGGSSRAGGFLFDKPARALKLSRPRSLPAHKVTPSVIAKTRESASMLRPAGRRLRSGKTIEGYIHLNDERSILIETAQCDQTAADAWIDGKWQGAGTRAILDSWIALGPRASYIAVVRGANVWLEDKGYSQRVQLEGREKNLNRSFLT